MSFVGARLNMWSECSCGNKVQREHVDQGTMVPCDCGNGLVPYNRWAMPIKIKPLPEGWTEDGCPKCTEDVRELKRMAAIESEAKQ